MKAGAAALRRWMWLAALAGAAAGIQGASAAHAQPGTPLADAELATLQGGKARLLAAEGVSVLVFFRPEHERSIELLKGLAACRRAFVGRPARWIAVVSDAAPAEAVRAAVRETRLDVPVLIDEGDAVYGRLGVAMHPAVVIVDRSHRLAAFEPFRAVDYCARVSARLRRALGDIGEAELEEALNPPRAVEGGDAQAARRYRALAEALLKAGNAQKALESARRSVELDPGLASAHALLGSILSSQGQCAEAAPAFRRALEIDPALSGARAGLERCGRP